MAPAKEKVTTGELHYTKVRDMMKKHNVKGMSKDDVEFIAKQFNITLHDKSAEQRFRGKMLAAIRFWDKE